MSDKNRTIKEEDIEHENGDNLQFNERKSKTNRDGNTTHKRVFNPISCGETFNMNVNFLATNNSTNINERKYKKKQTLSE